MITNREDIRLARLNLLAHLFTLFFQALDKLLFKQFTRNAYIGSRQFQYSMRYSWRVYCRLWTGIVPYQRKVLSF